MFGYVSAVIDHYAYQMVSQPILQLDSALQSELLTVRHLFCKIIIDPKFTVWVSVS